MGRGGGLYRCVFAYQTLGDGPDPHSDQFVWRLVPGLFILAVVYPLWSFFVCLTRSASFYDQGDDERALSWTVYLGVWGLRRNFLDALRSSPFSCFPAYIGMFGVVYLLRSARGNGGA